ncbi:MAG: AMP-binding protein, partial [Planctomycetes bacterium]|nr:AMP-binding protein [Planctomycetota bacterium]
DTPLKQNLINHIFVFENFPTQTKIDRAVEKRSGYNREKPELKSSGFEIVEHTNYDLNINVVPEGELTIRFQYNANVYDRKGMERIAGHFGMLIDQLLTSPGEERQIRQLELLSGEEKTQVLETFNNLKEDFPNDEATTIHSWFEEQVEKSPDHPAIHHNGRELTYRQLNRKANQLARLLRGKGVTRDTVVGLMGSRSIELVTGKLAIMKAGGAYLPVDDEFPFERKKYMLANAEIPVLVTNFKKEKVREFVPDSVEILDISRETIYSEEDDSNLEYINKSTDLVYVLYTSGSTGKPKGVMLEHRNVVNLLRHQYKHTNIDNSRFLNFSAISVDVAFHEIFSALLAGGCVYLVDKETRTDIPELFRIIRENEIKTVFFPMTFLKLLFSEEEYISLIPPCIDHIQTSGERVVISHRLRQFLKESGVYFHNHYGPAETHVVTTLTLDPRKDTIPELPSIGAPILNTGIYLVDKEDQPVPVGVPGELLIGGLQVGRGYIGREDLTAERFVPNPFVPNEKIYRTGDLA